MQLKQNEYKKITDYKLWNEPEYFGNQKCPYH
jgi:hypothetical protein